MPNKSGNVLTIMIKDGEGNFLGDNQIIRLIKNIKTEINDNSKDKYLNEPKNRKWKNFAFQKRFRNP